MPSSIRELSRHEARNLSAGEDHYSAYVGPPQQYDFMGATQFRLLTTLGLREQHTVLDFGCGSLRVGRLLIPYLLPEHYFGLEPNRWLIDAAIANEIGEEFIRIKKPVFRHEDDFSVSHFGRRFDFIIAQSIFSHTGADLVAKTLASFRECLNKNGLIAATFIPPVGLGDKETSASGWVYPECVAFERTSVERMIREAGLVGRELPWFHPRQKWFVMAHSEDELPSPADDVHLSGRVLRDPALRDPNPFYAQVKALGRRTLGGFIKKMRSSLRLVKARRLP